MGIKVTRLASGVPIGADMEYVDSLTSLQNRHYLNKNYEGVDIGFFASSFGAYLTLLKLNRGEKIYKNKYLGYENEKVCFIGEPNAYGVV